MSHECHGISDQWKLGCLLTCSSKKTSKVHITSRLRGESPVISWFHNKEPTICIIIYNLLYNKLSGNNTCCFVVVIELLWVYKIHRILFLLTETLFLIWCRKSGGFHKTVDNHNVEIPSELTWPPEHLFLQLQRMVTEWLPIVCINHSSSRGLFWLH